MKYKETHTKKLFIKNIVSVCTAMALCLTALQWPCPTASALGRSVVTLKKRAKTTALISMKKVKGATGYQIFVAPKASGRYKQVGASRTTSFMLSKLKKNKTYYVKVRTYHTSGIRITTGKYSKPFRIQKYIVLTTAEKYAATVLKLVNKERKKADLPELKAKKTLNAAANIRAKELFESNSPIRPDGRDGCSVLTDEDIVYESAGENIAVGVKTPAEVVEQWMSDPGHKAQILSEDYTYMGLGYYTADTEDKYYWSQLFIR